MRRISRFSRNKQPTPSLGQQGTMLIGFRLAGGGWYKLVDQATVSSGVGTGYHTRDSIFVNGKITTVGYNGNNTDIWNSVDSLLYTRSSNAPNNSGVYNFSGIAYGNGKYVAIAAPNYIFYSNDAVTWTEATNPLGTASIAGEGMYICFGNGRFVIVGQSGRVITSTDGINWTLIATGKSLGLLSYENGKWFGTGYMDKDRYTSIDGLSWNTDGLNNNNTVTNVVYSNGKYVRFLNTSGSSYVYLSTDGINWNPTGYVTARPNTKLVVKGSVIAYATATGNFIYSLDGGYTWTQRLMLSNANFAAILII